MCFTIFYLPYYNLSHSATLNTINIIWSVRYLNLICVLTVKRQKKDKSKKRVNDTPLSAEELMDTATFKRFNTAIDSVLESAEDIDLGILNAGQHLVSLLFCI